jgi:glycosyltransferase involved in cell wall biosynthesis
MSLSVAIITQNEEQTIRGCLESVSWADEIVVVDSGSTDNTVAICKELGAKVLVMDWPGFGPQKNRALALATGDWVLSLDADERVSPELRSEIQSAIANPGEVVAFRMPRLSSYCGRFMLHGGWWPDLVVRLFRRGSARFSEARVHERLEVEGMIGHLSSHLLHESFRDPVEVLEKVNHYSSEGARMLAERGRRASLGTAIAHGLWAFIRTYILKRGFLDGREGFAMAVSTAEASYYRYLKLMYLTKPADQ